MMKKICCILLIILLLGDLIKAETWNVFDKSVWDQINIDPNVNYQWGTVQPKGSAGITGAEAEAAKTAFRNWITQYPNFVRLQKPALNYSDTYYLNANVANTTSGVFHTAITPNTSYIIELKIQVGEQIENKTDANEIRARLGGRQLDFFLSYGDGTNGYIGKTKNGTDFIFDPSVPHTFRIEYTAGSSYDLYIDNIMAFSEATVSSTGANILIIGAPSKSSGNVDLYYVKMKTLDSPMWNILEKYMDGMTIDKGNILNDGVSITKNTDLTSGFEYVNINKEGNTLDADAQFFLTTTSNAPDITATAGNDYINRVGTGVIVDGEAYAVDIKARTPSGSNVSGSQIGVRLFNDKNMGIILGNGTVSVVKEFSKGIDADPNLTLNDISTSEWHDYRIVLYADKTTYDVFLDGDTLFSNIPTFSPVGGSGVNIIKLGAESWAECNLDIASVKMGIYKPEITSMNLSHDSHIAGNESIITVSVNTNFIANGGKLLFSLVDMNNTEIVTPVEVTVSDNVASSKIVIPANIAKGQYYIKVSPFSEQINNVASISLPYEIADTETGLSNSAYDRRIPVSLLNTENFVYLKTNIDKVALTEVVVFSLSGNEVYRKLISGTEYSFYAPTAPGIYIVRVCLDNDRTKEFKIIIN